MADGEAKSIYGPLDAEFECDLVYDLYDIKDGYSVECDKETIQKGIDLIITLRRDVRRHEEWIMASLDEKAELLDDLDTLTEILVDILDEVSDNEEMVKLPSIQIAMKSLNYRA